MKYDTEEVRRVAQQIKVNAQKIHDLERDALQPIARSIPQELRGRTADALLAEVSELTVAMRRLSIDVSSIGDELNSFARRLDVADQQAADAVKEQ